MTTYSVTSGQTSSGLTLGSSDFLLVSSGGTSLDTTVSGGTVEVFSGGIASVTSFTPEIGGGSVEVFSGGTAIGIGVTFGEVIVSGGTVLFTTLSLGGTEIVSSGGTASFTTVSMGSDEQLLYGGKSFSTTVGSGGGYGTQIVSSGGTASFTTVSFGGSQVVSFGGTAIGTTLNPTGYNDLVFGGGTQILAGGTASFTAVDSLGRQVVSSRGTAISTMVSSGGIETVFAGGKTSFTTVDGGGLEFVSSGGTAVSTTVDSGGVEFVYSGGSASGTTVGDGDGVIVYSGGSAVSTTVSSGGIQVVLPGGSQTSTTSQTGAEIVSTGVVLYRAGLGVTVLGDSVSDLVVGSGGSAILYVLNNGTATSITVSNYGSETVYSGGAASFTTVSGHGRQIVFSGGTTTSTTVSGYASETVYSGGAASLTVVDRFGSAFVSNGGSAIDTMVSSGGAAIISSGGVEVASSGSATSVTLKSGGVEDVYSGGAAISTRVSSGGVEVLFSGGTASFTSVTVGGAIDVTYLSYTSGGSATVNTSGVLSASVGGQAYTQQLSGDYADERFTLSRDTGSGTLLMANVPCYGSGTRILTDRGEVAVEELRVGERVQTVLGEGPAPIMWIGQREMDCAGHPKPRQVWPVRVAAGAFGPGRPHTELFLSPDHAVYVGEVLIPIRHLINGSTIAQVPVDRVTYYHLELPYHDVVLAQGLPAESFLDLRDGSNYANRPGPVRLYPDYTARMWEAFGCARLIVTGPELAAARALVDSFVLARTAA